MQNRAKFHFDNLYTPEQMAVGSYIIHQIGDLSCEPGYIVPDHVQEVHEISYVVSGKGLFYANGACYEVKRGGLFINSKGDVHKIVSSMDEPIRYMYLGFMAKPPVTSDVILTLDTFFRSPGRRFYEDAFDVQETFIRLLTETMIGDSFSALLKECCITELLCQVYRLLNPKRSACYRIGEGQHTDVQRLVYDVTHYLDANIGFIHGLSQLSEEFGYSYTYIAKMFSQQMGETLCDYYTRRRFEKARDYIQSGVSVTEAARLIGFQSIHAFSRAYKKYFGVCPRDTIK